jgi:hypothetical protein
MSKAWFQSLICVSVLSLLAFGACAPNPETGDDTVMFEHTRQTTPATKTLISEVKMTTETAPASGVIVPETAKNAEVPQEIILRAESGEKLKLSPQDSGDTTQTTLSGTLKLAGLNPAWSGSLNLELAEEVYFSEPSLENCNVVLKNFRVSADNKQASIILVGSESKNDKDPSGCLTQLSTMKTSGFVIVFNGVPASGVPGIGVRIPSVSLKLEPKPIKADQTK